MGSLHGALVLALTSLMLGISPAAHGVLLEGIFEGKMDLIVRGQARQVALAVALTPTGETQLLPAGSGLFQEEQVIDGAFVVDEEGGPYPFTKVTYRLEENILDLRYDRPDLSLKQNVPANFRLVGSVNPSGELTGKVISGTYGPLGTFSLSPSQSPVLPVKTKYVGVWRGHTTTGGGGSLTISISESALVSTNPANLEFEYTPGRLAVAIYNSVPFEMTNVVVDYLRGDIFLIQRDAAGGQSLVYECHLDPQTQVLSGQLIAALKGKNGTFRLNKVSGSRQTPRSALNRVSPATQFRGLR